MIQAAKNILVINFGQIGDVVLSLTAMNAIRRTFPAAKITALCGKSTAFLFEMSAIFDDVIAVDRVRLRDSSKIWSVKEIVKLASSIRRRKFDLVVDLHSLPETNILGFLSGSPLRLFANRASRSLDFLSNFRPKPPQIDFSEDVSVQYLRAIAPLGVSPDLPPFRISPRKGDLAKIDAMLAKDGIGNKRLIGLNIGAGNPTRRWALENFSLLAKQIAMRQDHKVLVFFGPEEKDLESEILSAFSNLATTYGNLNLGELAAMFYRLDVVIGGDTGPLHIASSIGTPVIFLSHPLNFYPPLGVVYTAAERAGEIVSVKQVIDTLDKVEREQGLSENDADSEKKPDENE